MTQGQIDKHKQKEKHFQSCNCIFIQALVFRSTRSLAFLSFILFSVALGELIFKRIVSSPRPARSCLHSCGMPSSHATLSIGYFTLMLLDALVLRSDLHDVSYICIYIYILSRAHYWRRDNGVAVPDSKKQLVVIIV